MYKTKHLRLGELLVKEGLINEAQLEKAVNLQKQEGGRLGEVLVKLGFVQEDQMVTVLGKPAIKSLPFTSKLISSSRG